jgi:hypothetical protein
MDEKINMKEAIPYWLNLLYSIICIVAGIAVSILGFVR